MRRLFLGLAIWWCLLSPVWASYYQMALKELNAVKAASLTLESIEETPWPTTVITAEHLERFGWRNLREVLEYQPSFYLVQDVNERVIAHRGIFRTNTSHLLFLENEIRLDAPDFHNFLGDYDYPLTNVARIEIVRGPASSLYGTAAFTGLVNIERIPPAGRGTLVLEGGEYQQELGDLALKKGSFYILGHYWHRRGPKVHVEAEQDYASVPVSGTQYVHPAPDNYALLGHWGASPEQGLFWWHFHHEYDTPRGTHGQVLLPEDTSPFGSYEKGFLDILAYKARLAWRGFRVEFQPHLTRFDLDSPQVLLTHREEKGPKFLDIQMESWRYGLDFRLTKDSPRGVFLFGGEAAAEYIQNYTLRSLSPEGLYEEELPSGTKYNLAFFSQYKYRTRKFLTNLGMRIDYYETFGTHISPRLALIWHIKPELLLNFSYGESFKAPPLFYQTANPLLGYGASQKLHPETLKNATIAINYYFNPRNYLRIISFYQIASDLLVYSYSQKEYLNAGKFSLLGLELEGQHFSEPLIFFLNYSQYFTIEEEDTPYVNGNYICSIPRWMLKSGISIKLPIKLKAYESIMFRAYGHVWHHSGREISAYILVDNNLSFYINNNLHINCRIENLFNKKYFRSGNVPPYPWPGRTGYISIKLDF